MKKPRRQDGQLWVAANGSIRLKYFTTEMVDNEIVRKRKDVFVCNQDKTHWAVRIKEGGKEVWKFSDAVQQMRDRVMLEVNEAQSAFHKVPVQENRRTNIHSIAGFWNNAYYPWAEKELRKSTRGTYGRIWNTHLKPHFGDKTFLEYTTVQASQYLTSLAEKRLSATMISHIRALGSAIFSHAVAHYGLLPSNPWDGAKSAKKYRQSKQTEFYTLEETEAILKSLADHPDWAALIGLCFFAGLRPSEAVAVRWEDFKMKVNGTTSFFLNVQRGCVDGDVNDTKTEASKQMIPLSAQIVTLLKTWHEKSGKKPEGWLFPAKKLRAEYLNGTESKPMDIRNLGQRQIKPLLEKRGFEWKGMYAFRRGLATHLKDLDIISAQAMLRHTSPDTTEKFYAKLSAADRVRAVKFLEGKIT